VDVVDPGPPADLRVADEAEHRPDRDAPLPCGGDKIIV
jgi:hypothetical protein